MIKAMKKLKKYWPRKKRRPRTRHDPYYNYYYHHHHHHHHHLPLPQFGSGGCSSAPSSSAPQPSAPPLPPWLDQYHVSENASPPLFPQNQAPTQDTVAGTKDICGVALQNGGCGGGGDATSAALLSYQQYMVGEPVYGVPLVKEAAKRERSRGFFGCVVDFGLNLFRCFCPCFHTKEVN